jgi:hypothetical protein
MSQKPRNPRYFPKMKVRGARRRDLAPWQRMYRRFDVMGESFAEVARTFGDFLSIAENPKLKPVAWKAIE